jgi:hypothetical protein
MFFNFIKEYETKLKIKGFFGDINKVPIAVNSLFEIMKTFK